MKKTIAVILVMCLVSTGIWVLPVIGSEEEEKNIGTPKDQESRGGVRGNTLYVGAGQTYSKIQDAIDASISGDIIRVHAGVYYENIIVDKFLTFIGNGSSNTTINGNNIDDVMKITADLVKVSRFKITNSGRNTSDAGIELSNVQNSNFTNNHIWNNSNGIHLNGSSTNNIIMGNNISSNDNFGIFLDSPPTGIGIVGFNDDNDYYIDVELYYNNSANSWEYNFPGDGKFTPSWVDFLNSTRTGGDVIINDDGARVGEWDSGDTIVHDPLNTLQFDFDDQINNYYTPFYTHGRLNFTGPLVDEELLDTYKSSLTRWADDDGDWNSTLHDIGTDGLPGTSDPGEGDMRPNPGEPWVDEDLYVNESRKPSNNIITGNNVSNNNYGIYLENTSNNILKWNIIDGNYIGVYSQCSKDNLFHHNDFINNNDHHAFDNSNNIWNTSTHGNYWSGWTTPDNDTNGIVDIPYSIAGFAGAKDHYPLVKPASSSSKAPNGTNGTAIILRTGQKYHKIQDAIDNAISGDTIFVYNGTYYENIIIDKSINLIGESPNQTIINGQGNNDVIHINASGVTIDSFTMKNSGNGSWYAGIALYNAKNCSSINNNVLSNGNFGIFLYQSSNNSIENNNISSNNEPGIYFHHSSANIIKKNMLIDNCIILVQSSNNIIESNDVYRIFRKDHVNGISISGGSENNMLIDNNIKNWKGNGVVINHADNNNISNNIIDNNGHGLYECCGLGIWSSQNNIISGNTITRNWNIGIFTIHSNKNMIKYNKIHDHLYGMDLNYSSYENIIYLNEFINNNNSVVCQNSNNSFNSTKLESYFYNNTKFTKYIGNYWDDYSGNDNDGDGIGDTPYLINDSTGVKDHYPLVNIINQYSPKYISIINWAPINNNVPIEEDVTITFDKEIDTTTIDLAFAITGGINGIKSWSNNNKTLTWSHEDFEYNKTYTATLFKSALRSITGLRLNQDFIWSFKTIIKKIPPKPKIGSVIIERTGEKFNKIQDAIDNAIASDTIRVWAGIYNENIVINKKLSLIGNSSTDTIIDGNHSGSVITINADLNYITGFKILNGSGNIYSEFAGIHILSDYNSIINIDFSYNDCYGLYLFKSKSNIIESCTFNSNLCSGINISLSNNNIVSNCKFISNVKGMNLQKADKNLIKYNNFSKNNNGIVFDDSHNNELLFNMFKSHISTAINIYPTSSLNSIYLNGFIDNNVKYPQANDYAGKNNWNDTKRGNYWADWTSPDNNNDGIVDYPYNLSGYAGAKDYFPLTNLSLVVSYTQTNQTPPKILDTNLGTNTNNFSVNNSNIVITFSNPMNRVSVEAALSISPGVNYTLYWAKNDTELIIVFSENLQYNTKYIITIYKTAMDTLGNNLNEPFNLEFTTQPRSNDGGDGQSRPGDNVELIKTAGFFGFIIFIIIIIIVFFAVITNKMRKRKEPQTEEEQDFAGRQEMQTGTIAEEFQYPKDFQHDSDEFMKKLVENARTSRKPSNFKVTKEEMLSKASIKYRKGKISKATYNSIKEIIDQQK